MRQERICFALAKKMVCSSVKKPRNCKGTAQEIARCYSREICLFLQKYMDIWEIVSHWRISIHINPVVTIRFLTWPCSHVLPEHAFTIAKSQEYKAPPSFFGQRKRSKDLLCTEVTVFFGPLLWKNGWRLQFKYVSNVKVLKHKNTEFLRFYMEARRERMGDLGETKTRKKCFQMTNVAFSFMRKGILNRFSL